MPIPRSSRHHMHLFQLPMSISGQFNLYFDAVEAAYLFPLDAVDSEMSYQTFKHPHGPELLRTWKQIKASIRVD